MIDAAAIFPLDAASHCGSEEENREAKHPHRLLLTFPWGKPLKMCPSVRQVTLFCKVKFFLMLKQYKQRKTSDLVVHENNKQGSGNDGEVQPLPQSFRWGEIRFQIMRRFSSVLRSRPCSFSFPMCIYEFLEMSSVLLCPSPISWNRGYWWNLSCLWATPLLFCPGSLSRLRIKPPPSSEPRRRS